MDVNVKQGVESDANGKILRSLECPMAVSDGAESDGDDESLALLPAKKGEMPRRKVQWLDRNGSKLAEIFVFQPRCAIRVNKSSSKGLVSKEQSDMVECRMMICTVEGADSRPS